MIVLDASVVVKRFSEEGHAEKALEIREKVRKGKGRVMNILYAAPDVPVHMGEFLKMVLKLFLADNIFILLNIINAHCCI